MIQSQQAEEEINFVFSVRQDSKALNTEGGRADQAKNHQHSAHTCRTTSSLSIILFSTSMYGHWEWDIPEDN